MRACGAAPTAPPKPPSARANVLRQRWAMGASVSHRRSGWTGGIDDGAAAGSFVDHIGDARQRRGSGRWRAWGGAASNPCSPCTIMARSTPERGSADQGAGSDTNRRAWSARRHYPPRERSAVAPHPSGRPRSPRRAHTAPCPDACTVWTMVFERPVEQRFWIDHRSPFWAELTTWARQGERGGIWPEQPFAFPASDQAVSDVPELALRFWVLA